MRKVPVGVVAAAAVVGAMVPWARRAPASGGPVWLKTCLHAHSAPTPEGLQDDGQDSPDGLAARLAEAGFDVAVHTPHSVFNRHNRGAAAAWLRTHDDEADFSRLGFLYGVGEELTVAPGPGYRSSYRILGHVIGGNLDHLSLIGITSYVRDGASIEEACGAAHAAGGFCIVNHPGPGPLEWEDGYWEAHAAAVDAIEVYNGQAYAALGIEYEGRYLDATAFGVSLGGRLLAATAAPDTHGAARVPDLRARLGRLPRLLATATPEGEPSGLELGAATMVLADDKSFASIAQAVRERRTVAIFGFRRLEVDCPQLGEVVHSGDVTLHLGVGEKVANITLYKEGRPLRTWTDASVADFHEHIDKPAAYVWGIVDASNRALTSAIWYEP